MQGAGCRTQGAECCLSSFRFEGLGLGFELIEQLQGVFGASNVFELRVDEGLFENNCLAKLWSGVEEGAYLRLIHCSMTQL